jgi:hypothetical protein
MRPIIDRRRHREVLVQQEPRHIAGVRGSGVQDQWVEQDDIARLSRALDDAQRETEHVFVGVHEAGDAGGLPARVVTLVGRQRP